MSDISNPSVFHITQGTAPLIVSIPHGGTFLPENVSRKMNPIAMQLDDTDWHLSRLNDFVPQLNASLIEANYSRYVIDLNRPPNNQNLYSGQNTTTLCPIDTFNEDPLYPQNNLPDDTEIKRRLDKYWRPYHDALQQEIERLHRQFGYLLLWDAHSIRSEIPRFFEGVLPDFNFGTNNNQTCMVALAEHMLKQKKQISNHSAVLNGRFKGGYITRHYGEP